MEESGHHFHVARRQFEATPSRLAGSEGRARISSQVTFDGCLLDRRHIARWVDRRQPAIKPTIEVLIVHIRTALATPQKALHSLVDGESDLDLGNVFSREFRSLSKCPAGR